MVEILITVLFARLSLLARTEGQTVTQHIERYFCIFFSILFTIQDVKCRSLTQDWKKKHQTDFHAILVPITVNILKLLFSLWSELQQYRSFISYCCSSLYEL